MMRSNSKRAQGGDGKPKEAEVYPGVAYFIAYRPNDLCDENAIFAMLHNADMEPTITKIHASIAAATLLQALKDHANTYVQNLVNASNTTVSRVQWTSCEKAKMCQIVDDCTQRNHTESLS